MLVCDTLTGPPGCCKSSMVRVLADELGFDVVEWTAPTPTMWCEHKYQVGLYRCGGGGAGVNELQRYVAACCFIKGEAGS